MYIDKTALFKSGLEDPPALYVFATSALPGRELPRINTAQAQAGPEATIRSPPAPRWFEPPIAQQIAFMNESPRRNKMDPASGSGSVPQPASGSGSVPQLPPKAEPKAAQTVEPPPKRIKSPPNAMPRDEQAAEIKEKS